MLEKQARFIVYGTFWNVMSLCVCVCARPKKTNVCAHIVFLVAKWRLWKYDVCTASGGKPVLKLAHIVYYMWRNAKCYGDLKCSMYEYFFFSLFASQFFFWFRFLFYSPLFFILHNLVGFTDDHLKLWRFFFRLWLFCSKCVICARVFLSLLFSKSINILTILSLILLTDWGEVTVMLCRLTHRHRHLYMLDLISNTKSEKERVMQKKAKSNTLKCLNAKL